MGRLPGTGWQGKAWPVSVVSRLKCAAFCWWQAKAAEADHVPPTTALGSQAPRQARMVVPPPACAGARRAPGASPRGAIEGADASQCAVRGSADISIGCFGWVPFVQSAAELVRILVELGCDPGAADWDGTTPLMVAAHFGNAEHVEALLEFDGAVQASCVVDRGGPRQSIERPKRSRRLPTGCVCIACAQAINNTDNEGSALLCAVQVPTRYIRKRLRRL